MNDLLSSQASPNIRRQYVIVWPLVFALLDDVKESVREVAASCIRTLNACTLRLCTNSEDELGGDDDKKGNESEKQQYIAPIVEMLLEQALTSPVKEVRAVRFVCIAVSYNVTYTVCMCSHN
jgi:hypothetical protein